MSNEMLSESTASVHEWSTDGVKRSLGTFGLGEVVDAEKICWNSKYCCRRKKCCPYLVMITVVMDILAIL